MAQGTLTTKKPKLRDVYHVEVKRTDPRQCADEAFTINCPEAALGILRDILSGREQESFIMLALDARNRITAWREVSRGTSDSVEIRARDLFRTALMCGAGKVVVAHNHPSGDPSPSPQDIILTRRLMAAGEIIGLDVLDHIIIGAGERFYSFGAGGMSTPKAAPLMTGPRQGPELD